MSKYLRAKWVAVEQKKKLKELYGENTHIVARDVKKIPHIALAPSRLDPLINRIIQVEQIDWTKVNRSSPAVNTFHITEADRANAKAHNDARKKSARVR